MFATERDLRACIGDIIHSHMDEMNNDDWIPVEENCPEEHDSILQSLEELANGMALCDGETV